jgi:ankyrin repeat protein
MDDVTRIIHNANMLALMDATERKDKQQFLSLLKDRNIDINFKDGNGTIFSNFIRYRPSKYDSHNQYIQPERPHNLIVRPDWLRFVVLEAGANINNPTWDGSLPIHDFLACGVEDLAICAIELGADVNAKDEDRDYITPLVTAADRGCSLPVIRALVEKGADVNGKGTNGITALFYVACHGDLETVKYLIAHGADVNNNGRFDCSDGSWDNFWTEPGATALYGALTVDTSKSLVCCCRQEQTPNW